MKQKLLASLANLQRFKPILEKLIANLKVRYEKLRPRHQYYVKFLLPFFFLWSLLGILGLPVQAMLFTCMGFFYPLFVNTPGVERMLDHKRYRLSLIRGIWRINQKLVLLLKNKNFKFKEEVNTSLFATVFCFLLSLLSWDLYFLLAPIGSALYFLLNSYYQNQSRLH